MVPFPSFVRGSCAIITAIARACLLCPSKIAVCGPSGVGKSTLVDKLRKEFPDDFGFSVSHTTRKPRPGEIDGVRCVSVQCEFVTRPPGVARVGCVISVLLVIIDESAADVVCAVPVSA